MLCFITLGRAFADGLDVVGRVVDIHFVPGRTPASIQDVQQLLDSLEHWKVSLPDHMRNGPEVEQSSIWTYLLHLAYKSVTSLSQQNQADFLLIATCRFSFTVKSSCGTVGDLRSKLLSMQRPE